MQANGGFLTADPGQMRCQPEHGLSLFLFISGKFKTGRLTFWIDDETLQRAPGHFPVHHLIEGLCNI